MNSLFVIILEPEVASHDPLVKRYHAFFEDAGFAADFHCVQSEPDARKLLTKRVCDLLICDLSFQREDNAGLMVVQSLKTDFPDLFCIGNSQSDVRYRQTAGKLPTFDMFIEKGSLLGGDKKYLKRMIEDFLRGFKKNTGLELDATSVMPDKLISGRHRLELLSLLSQVSFSSHSQDERLKATHVTLVPLSGGRSSSYVFRAEFRNDKSNLATVPAVLKISESRYATQEIENYNRFVKWVLPYTWRVDVLGSGFTRNFGAICYSFILSGYEEFETLSHFMEKGDERLVESAFQKIFSPKMRRWYGDELILSEESINTHYMNRYFVSIALRDRCSELFRKACQELLDRVVFRGMHTILVQGKRYRHPMDRLFGRDNLSNHPKAANDNHLKTGQGKGSSGR